MSKPIKIKKNFNTVQTESSTPVQVVESKIELSV